MPLPVIDLYNTIFPKTKKPTELEKLSSAGFGLLSGAFFFFPSKELLGGHTPMNGNIVAIVLPDLNPVHQLGNYQMLGFIAGIVKAAGPAQDRGFSRQYMV